MSFFAELQRRNVFRVAVFYVVASWLVIQAAETVLPLFNVPDGVLRGLVILLAIGFLPALVFSWVYEITPEGVKLESQIDRDRSVITDTGRKLNIATLLVAVLAIGLFALDRFGSPGEADARASAQAQAPTGQETGAGPESADHPSPDDDPVSIAVLPFVNMSDSPEQEYFSDGMTEEIINALVKIPDLSVAARTSVFAFKDHQGDARDIGEQLGVNHLLEGSVRSDGDHVRITAQLIKVEDGFHLWSDSYDRELTSVFAIQDEIARAIAGELAINLSEDIESVPNRTERMGAYDLYLKGRMELRERDLDQAVETLSASTEGDPDFAPAWAAMAIALQVLNELERAKEAANAALAIDPDNVDALSALASVYREEGRWAESEAIFKRALAIDPQSPELLEDYAEFLGAVGRFEPMLEISSRGYRVDPLLTPLADVHLSALILNGRMDDALALAQRPDAGFRSKLRYIQMLLAQEKFDQAVVILEQLLVNLPSGEENRDLRVRMSRIAELLRDPDNEDLRRAVIDDMNQMQFVFLTWMVLNAVGEHRAILDVHLPQVEASVEQSYHEWYWMPEFAPIRRLPRFAELLELMRLPEYWDVAGWPDFCQRLEAGEIECR